MGSLHPMASVVCVPGRSAVLTVEASRGLTRSVGGQASAEGSGAEGSVEGSTAEDSMEAVAGGNLPWSKASRVTYVENSYAQRE